MSKKYTEDYINKVLNEATESLNMRSAEAQPCIHACRKGHPLSSGNRGMDFRNAAFMLSGTCDTQIVIKLNKIGVWLLN